jgi:pre-mRNA-splicing factor ISY1
MFNRWVKGKQEAMGGEKDRRPYLSSECKDLNQADKWRQEILREIGKKVMEIQNAGLGEVGSRSLPGVRSVKRTTLAVIDQSVVTNATPY